MDEPDQIFFNFIGFSEHLNNVQRAGDSQKLGIVIGYLISQILTDELLTGDSEIYRRPTDKFVVTGNFIVTCDFIVVFVNY